jgi:hypothetical protein
MSRNTSFSDRSSAQTLTVKEAGRLGGLTVLQKRGRSYFAEIGRIGQTAMRQKHPNMASVWGRKGGRPKKPNLEKVMGENGK